MATYTLISSNTLASSTSTVTFSSIPSTYTDLCIRGSVRLASAVQIGTFYMRINASTSTYSWTRLRGNGATASSSEGTTGTEIQIGLQTGASATANTFGSFELYIPNYAGSTNKPFSSFAVAENNSATAGQSGIETFAELWSTTSAITSLTFSDYGTPDNMLSGSSFYLYGISNA
jgi:hypothetical protein